MIRINLLPWREQLREERKRQFLMAVAVTTVIAIIGVFLASRYLEMQIDNQNIRNNYLSQQITVMDERLKVIEDLRAKRGELLARMKIIQDLQSNRQILARLLDQFVRTLPDGVFYTSLNKTDKKITINGITASNNRVSTLMRNFETSAWLASPNLTVISQLNQKDPLDKTSTFTLQVMESEPKDEGSIK